MKIPSKSNPKWQELVLSNEAIQFKNLAFQMLIIRTKERFNNNEIDIKEAIYVLHDFCKKNILGSKLQQDLNIIFDEDEVFDTKKEVKATSEDINRNATNYEIKNQAKINLEASDYSITEDVSESKELDSDINFEYEREKLTKQLEALKIQFNETQKSNNQKKNEGFFKKLFK